MSQRADMANVCIHVCMWVTCLILIVATLLWFFIKGLASSSYNVLQQPFPPPLSPRVVGSMSNPSETYICGATSFRFVHVYFCRLQDFDGKIPFDFETWLHLPDCCSRFSTKETGLQTNSNSNTCTNV